MILTSQQVADRLCLTPRHVRDLLRDGEIPAFKRGKRVWGVFLVEFERWLASRGGGTSVDNSSKVS